MSHGLALSPAEHAALDAFVSRVRKCLGTELREVRLFGSRARHEGNETSDLDLALIVTPRGRSRRNEVYDLAFDLSLEHGVQIAPMVIEEERLQLLTTRERLLARELKRDGIVL